MLRSLLALPLAAAVAIALPGIVAAASPANLNSVAWEEGQSVDGGATWTTNSLCDSGNSTAGSITTSYRCAFEFSLASIPSGATVTSANLWLRTTSSTPFNIYPVDLGGYTGNGTGSLADLTAGSKLLTFTAVYNTGAASANPDVTSFIAGLVNAHAGFAGFNLSSSGTNDQQDWQAPGTGAVVGEPLLIVNYTVAAPTPTPTPAPTPTATAAPNPTATPRPTATVLATEPPTSSLPTATPSGDGLPVAAVLLVIALSGALVLVLPRRRTR
jgi:hypothetical protein